MWDRGMDTIGLACVMGKESALSATERFRIGNGGPDVSRVPASWKGASNPKRWLTRENPEVD